MNNSNLANELYKKIKEIEIKVSGDYIGKLSDSDQKAYQKDVVGMIRAEIDNFFKEEERG